MTKRRAKLTRRIGESLFLFSGIRPEDPKSGKVKFNLSKRPGVHGAGRVKKSGYSIQLTEKQKVKYIYGVSTEKQFRNYFKKANALKGATGLNLLKLLESRLDNVVYRMGFASTRAEARQLVGHRSMMVNGRVVNYPSYQVQPGDVISVRERSRKQTRITYALDLSESREPVEWVEVDASKFEGKFVSVPEREQLSSQIKETLIVELYSK